MSLNTCGFITSVKMAGFIDYLSTMGYLLLIADSYAVYVIFRLIRGAALQKEMGVVPLVSGIASLGLALSMSIAWPLPGPFNFIFGDPFMILSVLLIAAGAELLCFGDLKYIEGLAVPAGLIAILYGLVIGIDALDPIYVYGMFILEGLAGAGAGAAVNTKSKALLWTALILLVLATALLAVVCVETSFGHVTDFAKYYP